MASPVVDCAAPIRGADMEEDEEELFEINLEAVNGIPPPPPHHHNHRREPCSSTVASAAANNYVLLANCLLPVADVSNAVPTAEDRNALSFKGGSNFLLVSAAPMPVDVCSSLLRGILVCSGREPKRDLLINYMN
ncbi:uncharacterized protein LOC131159645 [Malania oleifera]|uniref:uncharacterized protein LOC131159645 n=1 Tax=Malania oleifera TaxID=397392 RepID=UPI0025AE9736|nr:uncharacterized protein LOC131159645 [Malania oleifera]